jgi:penicillin G amidase
MMLCQGVICPTRRRDRVIHGESFTAPVRVSPTLLGVTRRRIALGLSVVAALVVLAVIAAAVFTIWSVRRPFPEYNGMVAVPRLQADVEVVRDENGIPHIFADTAEDLFRAQGYVHAQDRFWEMDFRRHVTSGRLSELFGPEQVGTDALVRAMGWRDVAQQEFPLLAPSTRRYLQAYADGVNAWLDGRSGGEVGFAYTILDLFTAADTSPRRWSAIDSLAWLKAMAWDLRANLEDEITRALLAGEVDVERVEQLYPDFPYDEHPPIVPDEYVPTGPAPAPVGPDGEEIPDQARTALSRALDAVAGMPTLVGSGEGIGSNSWVVDGSRTTTGAPMLANDPHLSASMPSIWYQMGLHCREISSECPFDVTGFSFSGMPGIVIGYNDRIAWGVTNLGADVSDLYLEQVEGDLYRVGDRWERLETRSETIRVVGAPDVSITVRRTRNGPIMSDHSGDLSDVGLAAPVDAEDVEKDDPAELEYAVALKWTALEPGRTADALFMLNEARDWESFREAAAMFEVPAQNLVYADVAGNIGYQTPGRIPMRAAGDGRWPVPGWTGEYDWLGYVPFDALPSVLNPDEGYIVTANQPVTSPAYPVHLTSDFDYGDRAARLVELIEDAGPLDTSAMLTLQMDSQNPMAETLVPHLLDLGDLGDYYRDGIELLRDWDYSQPPDSAPAAYFNSVWRELLRLTFHDELPEEQLPDGGGRWFEVVRHLLEAPDDPFWDDSGTAQVETRDDILIDAARVARDDMTRRQGKDPANWKWGRLHALELREQSLGTSGIGPVERLFNRGPVQVGGGSSIVQATKWDAAEGFETIAVPSMRMVIDLSDRDASRWIDLTGVSGHPYHDHYADQTELWRTGQSLPMRSDPALIRAAAVATLVLTPRETD